MKKFLSGLLGGGSATASLTKDGNGKPISVELQTAATAMLIEIAGSDREIAEREAQEICVLIHQHLAVSESAVADLLDSSVTALHEAGSVQPFIAKLRENFNEKQRVMLLSLVWRMVHADGTVADFEKRLANDLKFKLGLSNEQAAIARKLAEEKPARENSK